MPRKTPVRELQKEEVTVSSPLRRSSRISNNASPVPTKVVTRRSSASEATTSTPKPTRGRRSSFNQDVESTETQAETKKTTTTRTRKSSISLKNDSEEEATSKPKTRASSVTKETVTSTPEVKKTTRRRRSVTEESEPSEEDTAKKATRSRSGSLSKKNEGVAEPKTSKKSKSSESVDAGSTPIRKKSRLSDSINGTLESIEEINREAESPKDDTPSLAKKKKTEATKIDFDLSVIDEASITEEETASEEPKMDKSSSEEHSKDETKAQKETKITEKVVNLEEISIPSKETNDRIEPTETIKEIITDPTRRSAEIETFESSADSSFNLQLSSSVFENSNKADGNDSVNKENICPKPSVQEVEPMDVDEEVEPIPSPVKAVKSPRLNLPEKEKKLATPEKSSTLEFVQESPIKEDVIKPTLATETEKLKKSPITKITPKHDELAGSEKKVRSPNKDLKEISPKKISKEINIASMKDVSVLLTRSPQIAEKERIAETEESGKVNGKDPRDSDSSETEMVEVNGEEMFEVVDASKNKKSPTKDERTSTLGIDEAVPEKVDGEVQPLENSAVKENEDIVMETAAEKGDEELEKNDGARSPIISLELDTNKAAEKGDEGLEKNDGAGSPTISLELDTNEEVPSSETDPKAAEGNEDQLNTSREAIHNNSRADVSDEPEPCRNENTDITEDKTEKISASVEVVDEENDVDLEVQQINETKREDANEKSPESKNRTEIISIPDSDTNKEDTDAGEENESSPIKRSRIYSVSDDEMTTNKDRVKRKKSNLFDRSIDSKYNIIRKNMEEENSSSNDEVSDNEKEEEKDVATEANDDVFESEKSKEVSLESLGEKSTAKSLDESLFEEPGEKVKRTEISIISQSLRRKSLDKTAITLQETIKAGENADKNLSGRIHKVVDLFCAGIKNKADVSINVSLEYTAPCSDDEKAANQSELVEISMTATDASEKLDPPKGSKRRKICSVTDSDEEMEILETSTPSSVEKKERSLIKEQESPEVKKSVTPHKQRKSSTPTKIESEKDEDDTDEDSDEAIEEEGSMVSISSDESLPFEDFFFTTLQSVDDSDSTWKPSTSLGSNFSEEITDDEVEEEQEEEMEFLEEIEKKVESPQQTVDEKLEETVKKRRTSKSPKKSKVESESPQHTVEEVEQKIKRKSKSPQKTKVETEANSAQSHQQAVEKAFEGTGSPKVESANNKSPRQPSTSSAAEDSEKQVSPKKTKKKSPAKLRKLSSSATEDETVEKDTTVLQSSSSAVEEESEKVSKKKKNKKLFRLSRYNMSEVLATDSEENEHKTKIPQSKGKKNKKQKKAEFSELKTETKLLPEKSETKKKNRKRRHSTLDDTNNSEIIHSKKKLRAQDQLKLLKDINNVVSVGRIKPSKPKKGKVKSDWIKPSTRSSLSAWKVESLS